MRYLVLFCAVLASGCLTDPVEQDTMFEGRYDLVAYRDDGGLETKGWVSLAAAEDSLITGTWSLLGLEGDGSLEGWATGDEVSINLHPGWADHNFFLHGTHADGTISGRWEFVGFAGPMKGGTFIARK